MPDTQGPTHELPMFPLGATLLPGEPLPLHVFEPRYRELVQRCLATDRRFGVVLIERGSEVGGGDVRTDVGTVAEIVDHTAMGPRRFALSCQGIARIRVAEWLPDAPFPRAAVTPWPDPTFDGDWPTERDWVVAAREELLDLWRELADRAERRAPEPAPLALPDDPSECSFALAAALPISQSDRHRALTASSIGERCAILVEASADVAAALRFRLQ
ncbi:LON peptidase substrate-binding domain-containing protein [Jongsikchunia kroppenstedtii]|uniref:LON peptidase substrate-binding domain-containing protein n=1 Tax=Jongsikchunia kroppenstedtii TaxID=1121721 RepID=UPI000369168C|nr:LON peptidase substrate-binding domain-containing protein [Jongsikchunia kroppenstedtii]